MNAPTDRRAPCPDALRRLAMVGAAALLVPSACGEAPRPATPSTESRPSAAAPYREVIPPDELAKQRIVRLKTRDAPLAVGQPAPRFEGFPVGRRAVIVFYRGDW